MANLLVLGTQWGDEGKGKIVDLLTSAFDIVARYQGGHNAGHTVYVRGKKVVLHLIPSGILHRGKQCVIGNGLVFSPKAFLDELRELKRLGAEFDEKNIIISKGAHLILPYHPLLERACEEEKGDKKIGTTCRGIGPCYEDKAARCGIRVGDLLDLSVLEEKIGENVRDKNAELRRHGLGRLDPGEIFEEYAGYAAQILPFIRDVSLLLDEAMTAGKSVLFEGAQGALLDLDHGTYPYVTSSNSTAGGVCTGLGVGPDKIHGILGVTKAYTTRVGSGPFPTELFDERGKRLAARGDEFGATTGRPRRCGWFDALAVSYARRINGISKIAMTKPDVLEELEEIMVCDGYTYKGERLKSFPTEAWVLEKVVPRYRTMPGWRNSVHRARDFSALPQAFQDYLKLIEDLTETKVAVISTGVERTDTILRAEELGNMLRLEEIMKDIKPNAPRDLS